MSEQSIESARALVENALGSAVESKATNAFCLEYARASAATDAFDADLAAAGATLEMAGPRPRLVHAVIELDPPVPLPSPGLDAVVKQMRACGAWEAVRKSAAEALGTGADGALGPRTAALLHPTLLMREIYIKEMRERCLVAMSPIRDRLEQDVRKLLGDRDTGLAASPTQVCWLNQTIRTWTDPDALAATAADTSVRSIDVPRALAGELKETGNTVGAVQHRTTTQRAGGVIVVAVIDGEVSITHPALLGRVVHRRNFTHEAWGTPHVHGTAVAGIIAAQGDEGLVGMAPAAVIYNYKVLSDKQPAGDFELACALQQALEDGARIANCSLNSKTPPNGQSRLARACDNAWALGMTIVKSAGNGGAPTNGEGTITCPGDARGVIVVGATLRNGTAVTKYSSRGPMKGKPFCPDLVAPGGERDDEVFSCTLDGNFGKITPGTSLAAPHVTGLLALILEGRPDLTPDEQRELLLQHCDPAVNGGDPDVEGRGRISIARLDQPQV